jgi:hypothetical protein
VCGNEDAVWYVRREAGRMKQAKGEERENIGLKRMLRRRIWLTKGLEGGCCSLGYIDEERGEDSVSSLGDWRSDVLGGRAKS